MFMLLLWVFPLAALWCSRFISCRSSQLSISKTLPFLLRTANVDRHFLPVYWSGCFHFCDNLVSCLLNFLSVPVIILSPLEHPLCLLYLLVGCCDVCYISGIYNLSLDLPVSILLFFTLMQIMKGFLHWKRSMLIFKGRKLHPFFKKNNWSFFPDCERTGA